MTSTSTVFSDLNVRLSQVDDSDNTIISDKEAVAQSVYRLFSTVEGEIPYYRTYGLNLKQFIQKPLTKSTTADIFDHVKQKIITFEPRAEIVTAVANADRDNGVISLIFTIKVKATNELIQLQSLDVQVAVG